jgi:SOS response associated peptidase (SRAP)
VAGLAKFRTLSIAFRYKSVELFLADTLFASRCIALSYDCFASSTRAVTSAVHDRMPVILDPDCYDHWLDPGMKNVDAASELLKSYNARLMRCYSISTRINHVANDDEGCSTPVELAEVQHRLFQ